MGTGDKFIVGCLFIQLFFGAFIGVAVCVGRCRQRDTMEEVYTSSILILVRSMFCVIDCLQRFAGYVLSCQLRRIIKGTPATISGLAPNTWALKLAGYPQLLAALSRGHGANVSGGNRNRNEERSRQWRG